MLKIGNGFAAITLLILAVAPFAQADVENRWTSWLNRDLPSGNGDYELFPDLRKEQPSLTCAKPTAIQARLRGVRGAQIYTPANPPREIIRTFSAESGFSCVNANQPDGRCDDYEVRFLCAPQLIGDLNVPILRSEVLQLTQAMREGNAIALVTLGRDKRIDALPTRLSVENDELITVLNDEGVGADAEAGDLVFSGFTSIDTSEIDEVSRAAAASLARVKAANNGEIKVKEFSGRAVADTKSLDDIDRLQMRSASFRALAPPVRFPAKRVLPPFVSIPPPLVDPENALMITDLDVVANPAFTYDPCDTDGRGNDIDPDAPYSFKTLITNLNDENLPGRPSDQQFVHNWLVQWMNTVVVNNFNIQARQGIVDYFPGWDGVNASTLDLNRLPLRLLAVVNRIDLSSISAYGNSSANKPGEIRFVFGLLDMNPATGACIGNGIANGINQMTAIFEYRDATNSCASLRNLANDWINLNNGVNNGSAPLGSPQYMSALKAITDTVTVQGANKLNQLRTNDFAFDGRGRFLPWELREFVYNTSTFSLEPATIKQTPDFRQYRGFFNPGAATLADYVLTAAVEPGKELLCDAHSVPLSFNGQPFLGANTLYSVNTSWPVNFSLSSLSPPTTYPQCYKKSYIPGTEVGIPPNIVMEIEMRHKLSLNACDDCHAQETGTFFTHISPETRVLSGFLTGIEVVDPSPSNIKREFNDLVRRNQVMSGIANSFCRAGPVLIKSFQADQARMNFSH